MDTDLLKTFLEVDRTRHFGKAAENLFLTQSAVSARIRQLEGILGVSLFTRARNDIQPTPAGKKLKRHAQAILDRWTRTRQEIAIEDEAGQSLAVGAVPSLWDLGLQRWVHSLYHELPDLVIHAEAHDSSTLLRRVRERSLDIAFVYDAPEDERVRVEEYLTIRLLMVSTRAGLRAEEAIAQRYVLVDWGTSFAIAHARSFPDMPTPIYRVDLGRLARDFILEEGGCAYLAESMIEPELNAGRLHVVADAPVIERRASAVSIADVPRRKVEQIAIERLQSMARAPRPTRERARLAMPASSG